MLYDVYLYEWDAINNELMAISSQMSGAPKSEEEYNSLPPAEQQRWATLYQRHMYLNDQLRGRLPSSHGWE